MEDSIVEKINKAAVKFLMPLTPDKTYEIIVKEAIKLMNADYGSILLDIEGDLKRVYGSAAFLYTVRNRKNANTYKAFKEQRAIVAYVSEIGKVHPQLAAHGVNHTVFIPLSYENKSLGVLTINSCKDVVYSQRELDLFKLYGTLATMAIRKTQLYNETKKTLEIRDFFIALAAQELRTPITTINGYIKLLETKLTNPETSEYKWIMKLAQESNRLTHVVHDLLEINRVKAGKLQYAFQQCDVETLVEEALTIMQKERPHQSFIYESRVSATKKIIIADPAKLVQVFCDVLDNASKYSPEGVPVEINIKNTSSKISIQIKDKGIGINKNDLPYIFEGFYKPDYNQEHGLVIGLLLAKHIIEAHKGEITLKSNTKRGTIVEINIPIIK